MELFNLTFVNQGYSQTKEMQMPGMLITLMILNTQAANKTDVSGARYVNNTGNTKNKRCKQN